MIDQLMQLVSGGDPRRAQMMMQAIGGLIAPQGGQAGGVPMQRGPQMAALPPEGTPDTMPYPPPPGGMMPSAVQDDMGTKTMPPDADEAMLAQIQQQMGTEGAEGEEVGDDAWEGDSKTGPTESDIRYMSRNPTDGVLEDFEKHFGIRPNVNWESKADMDAALEKGEGKPTGKFMDDEEEEETEEPEK